MELQENKIRAVLFDFGGVITRSPFEAFNRYEKINNIPTGFIQKVNSNNPDNNAWAKYERNEITPEVFNELFFTESKQLGHKINGHDILGLLQMKVRKQMVDVVKICGKKYITACLTNNGASELNDDRQAEQAEIFSLFNYVIESSKLGVRKPEEQFYSHACDTIGIKPEEAVFLDDLGINLKPARQMGMITIKVEDPKEAIEQLQTVLGINLLP